MVVWQGLEPNPDKYFGFVYLIICDTNNKKYIGKKQYWMAKPKTKGCKTKVTDKSSEKWKQECWKESNWKDYTGSSKQFNELIKQEGIENFTFIILGQYVTKGDLYYAEIKEQIKRGVMETDEYYNGQVAGIKFKPPMKEKEEYE